MSVPQDRMQGKNAEYSLWYHKLLLPVYIHHNHLSLDTKQSVHLILPAKHCHLKQQIENQEFLPSLCQQLLQYILRKQRASKSFLYQLSFPV